MNPDLANLLGALRDQPDDEIAYLALADWCLEQPDEATQARAEHVRLSLALGKTSRTDTAARALRERIAATEKGRRTHWLGSLRQIGHRCDFLPGGLVKLEVTGRRAAQAREAKVPPPTEETFAWVSSLVARSISLDELRRLGRLLPQGYVRSFHAQVPSGAGLAEVLADCRCLRGVRGLDLYSHSTTLDSSQPVRFAGLERLSDLRSLRIYCGLSMAEVRALCSGLFASLNVLSLENMTLQTPAADVLAAWPTLANVRHLRLDSTLLGDDGLTTLARSPHLGELQSLSMLNCGLTSRGLQELAGAPFRRMASLDVRNNDAVNDAGLLAICRSSSLSSLSRIWYSRPRNGLRRETLTQLQARFGKGHNPQP